MNYVHLGRSGMTVSRICLGMMSYGDRTERAWHLDEMEAEPIVRAAVEAGVIFSTPPTCIREARARKSRAGY